MDLTWTDEQETFRSRRAIGWRRTLTPGVWRHHPVRSGDTRDGFAQHLEWERELHAGGWSAVSWPAEYGGREASLWGWLLFEEEYYRADCPPRVTQNGIFLRAPSLFEFGNDAQRRHILPRVAAAEDLWCQGWSEPGAGSDLAAVSSRARRVDGGWVLDGQKTWTTRGAFCTRLFGLFRTDPRSTPHAGLTYFLVPLDGPGVTVRGFGRLDGDEGFAEVFFEDAFVPDDVLPGGPVLGAVGGGWTVAMATAGSERGLTLRSPGRFAATVERLVALARHVGDRPDLTDRLVQGLAVRTGRAAVRGHQRDPAQHRRRADPRPSERQPLMEFAFNDEQRAFADTVQDLLAATYGPAEVRAAWEAPAGELDRGVWKRLVDVGVTSALVPARDGGLGLHERWLALVLERVGHAALPHPLVETAVVLPVVAPGGAGEAMVTSDLGGRLVPAAADADALLLRAPSGALHLVPRAAVEVSPATSIDRARRLGRVAWTPHDATFVTDDPARVRRAELRGAWATAAVLIGLADAMLELAVGYVRERRQFGVPVGSFQAVKHHLADAALEVAFAPPAVHRAAWSLAVGEPRAARDVAMAKAVASTAATQVGRRALQCHGAMGYTVEYDLHLYLKRVVALSAAWGTPAAHRAEVARWLGLHRDREPIAGSTGR